MALSLTLQSSNLKLPIFSVGTDDLMRLQRLDLEDRVVSLSFPALQLLLWIAPNLFHFRVVLWFGLFL